MARRRLNRKSSSMNDFDMTPIIDIVFLLIIFFMLVCQFIVAENFEVSVPDKATNAQEKAEQSENFTTVTVINSQDGTIFAAGAQQISGTNRSKIIQALKTAIDRKLENVKSDKKIVSLRIDREIPYRQSQLALAAVALSKATDIKLAVNKQKVHTSGSN